MPLPPRPMDLQAAAQEKLLPGAYNYYAYGALSEQSVAENETSWAAWHLRPRMLVDVSSISLKTTVLGSEVSLPVLLAPCAMQRFAHPDGEVAAAKGAAAAGTIYCVSSTASMPYDEIARSTPAPKWYQLYYWSPDSNDNDDRIRKVADLGYETLAITTDLAQLGVRYQGMGDRQALMQAFQETGVRASGTWPNPALDWKEVERLRGLTDMKTVLKGILHPADAVLAAEAGIDGIVVSNHGGRQLDGTVPPAHVLPEIVEAVDGRCEVYVDGGIRTGLDVLRALALGARAAFIGRPFLWALTVDGEAGVSELLEQFRRELDNAMALAGQTDVTNIARDIVVPARPAVQPL